jgi:phage shock protein A
MNESIAMVRANVTLLEKENAKYKAEVNDLTAKVKAAIQANRDDLAAQYATRLQMEKSALARNEEQLSTARAAYDKAMNVKKMFMREKDKKTQEAKLQAMELVKQFKMEMGITSPAPVSDAGETAEKTIGKKVEVK